MHVKNFTVVKNVAINIFHCSTYILYTGDHDPTSHRSGYSDISSVSTSKRGVGTMKGKGPR